MKGVQTIQPESFHYIANYKLSQVNFRKNYSTKGVQFRQKSSGVYVNHFDCSVAQMPF